MRLNDDTLKANLLFLIIFKQEGQCVLIQYNLELDVYSYTQKLRFSKEHFVCGGSVRSFGSMNCGTIGKNWGTGLHK
jgi:hypothetical protein